MRHIVPSSKIVFTDFMILLVSVMMGLNSVMSFSKDRKEILLPSVNLPVNSDNKETGLTVPSSASITIRHGKNGKVYFFNNKEVTLWQLMEQIQKASVRTVVLRGDRETVFEWQEFYLFTSELMKAGVREISYATVSKGGPKP